MATPQETENISNIGNPVSNSHKPLSLRIMTYNCLGLKYISQHRRARLAEIGRAIALLSPPPQIVGLQECWTQEDYASIRASASSILPYAKFYYSGIFGGGLAILSAFPIEDSSMYRYPLNGRPTAFFRGDWFVGKGVACATIRLPSHDEPPDGNESTNKGDTVEVFCTHLHAPYEPEPGDSYLCHRTAQAWEIAKLMRGAAQRGHLVVGLGDFNMLPLSLAHRVITARGNVVDAWRVLHPDSSLGPATFAAEQVRKVTLPSARFNLEVNGAASDNVLNTWRWEKSLQKAQYRKGEKSPAVDMSMDTPDPHAKRLDYIFIGNGRHPDPASFAASKCEWEVADMHVGMTQLHPTIHCSLSDHFSIHATLTRSAAATVSTRHIGSQLPSQHSPSPNGPVQTYTHILTLIQIYTARELFQRKARLAHFIFWLIVSLGCLVAVWFAPRPFVSFILILMSTLGFATGVVDGLIGGLFMSSELRALKEFEWEVSNAMAVAAAELREGEELRGRRKEGK